MITADFVTWNEIFLAPHQEVWAKVIATEDKVWCKEVITNEDINFPVRT